MVGYYYNKYECWSGASVSHMHDCMYKFTDMTFCLDATVKDMGNGQMAMACGRGQMQYT